MYALQVWISLSKMPPEHEFFFFFGVKFSKLKITIGGFWAMVSICTGDVPE